MLGQSKPIIKVWESIYLTVQLLSWYGHYLITPVTLKYFLGGADISELFSLLKVIQESNFMLNFISNSSTFVLKRSQLLHGRGKDSLSKVLMSVQRHIQTFLPSSTNFYHTTCFKYDLCRVCSGIFKLVNWMHYISPNKIPKTITYHVGVFRHHVHHSARN